MGIGVGLVFSRDASTGGTDVTALLIHKITRLSLAKVVLTIDAGTVLLGFIAYDIKSVLLGTISVWISSYMIDKALMSKGKNVLIISDQYNEIKEEIHEHL